MATKHLGQVINTGKRCVVVFREIYNENGEIVDPNSCLVVETDGLPDRYKDDLMRIVQSVPGQQSANLFNVLARERFSDGSPPLNWLYNTRRLQKYKTDQIMLIPDSNTQLRLDKLNRIVEMQKAGKTETEINNAMVDDTDAAPRTKTTANKTEAPAVSATSDDILDDAALAKQRLDQAESFATEAERLREEAYSLDPSLKPKRTRSKKAAN